MRLRVRIAAIEVEHDNAQEDDADGDLQFLHGELSFNSVLIIDNGTIATRPGFQPRQRHHDDADRYQNPSENDHVSRSPL